MINLRFMAVATALVATSGVSLAGVVQVQANPGAPWQRADTSGGGFRATTISGFNGVMGGRGGTATSFITFCLERNEQLSGNNAQYNTEISTSATMGGGGAIPDGKGGMHDPITAVTATLYREFRFGGTFGGIATAGLDSSSWSTSLTDSLQLAIWFEEGELTNSSLMNQFTSDNAAVAMHTWAMNQVANLNLGQYDIGNVRVLRMFNADGSNSQDLLTIIPLPSAAGLACLGLIAVGGRNRRRAF
ncbi:MAG: hypothetical protein EA379_12535 [Phycisphaerales bacterium]|nr:MAG: hypothetical protein EA379_12535 [Phycisphaerales bacterium]